MKPEENRQMVCAGRRQENKWGIPINMPVVIILSQKAVSVDDLFPTIGEQPQPAQWSKLAEKQKSISDKLRFVC